MTLFDEHTPLVKNDSVEYIGPSKLLSNRAAWVNKVYEYNPNGEQVAEIEDEDGWIWVIQTRHLRIKEKT